MENYYRNTVIEINLDQIKNNINEVKQKCAKDKFFYAVIKGDAYGHGIKQVANVVVSSNADGIAVATLDEALLVRKYHKDFPILCLGIINYDLIKLACVNNIAITVANSDFVDALVNTKLNNTLNVHFKVNSGMNRIGFNNKDEIMNAINNLKKIDFINIEGIFTHFATAEDYDKEDYLQMQINFFKSTVEYLDFPFKQIHCSNSASLLKLHDKLPFTNTCRAGITLYGALEDKIQDNYNIKSGFKLKSKISHVQRYPKDTKLSYSIRYSTLKNDEIIATIPLGYADGFSRLHTGSKVKCNGIYGTIVGSICMDQLMIRFDEMVNINDEVIIIDNDSNLSVYQRCKEAMTITHEIFTRFSNRIPKLYYLNNELIEIDNALLKK